MDRFICGDAFTLGLDEYDPGCFHHLPPHQRVSYLALLDRCLAEEPAGSPRFGVPFLWTALFRRP